MRNIKSFLIFWVLVSSNAFSQGRWIWQNPLPQGNDLQSVQFIDVNIGWAVGSAGTILKTKDGGLSWTLQSSGTTSPLRDIQMIDQNEGWVVGDSVILKTIDGGTKWIDQSQGGTYSGKSVFFIDFNVGWIGGGGILKTVNGGTDWQKK